ncbi:MAG: U32 family peptidase [Candidatus Jorgensenbacteria bacterium]|nr:U32 family peptidase [Candidatus Jorgensenbacteria bacterium]
MEQTAKRILNRSSLSIPCHWDKEVMDRIVNIKAVNGIKVMEVYGVLAEGGPVGHGRSRNSVVNIEMDDALKFRAYLKNLGLRFVYLLNAPFKFDGSAEQKKQLNSYLEWILGSLRPDALTLTSHELMRYVRVLDKKIPLYISTIAGIKSWKDLEEFLDISPSRVIPHHDVGKDWKVFMKLSKFCKKEGVEIELMATESCLFRCSRRDAHYKYLSQGSRDVSFHVVCNSRKLIHPREFLLAGGVIRPEDVCIYEDAGVTCFKITGRSKPSNWLPEVVNAYQNRGYNGNLIRLLGIDPSLCAENWIYISNAALNGFLGGFINKKTRREMIRYSETWIAMLYNNGQFKLFDGSQYKQRNGSLVLSDDGGKQAKLIISRESEK